VSIGVMTRHRLLQTNRLPLIRLPGPSSAARSESVLSRDRQHASHVGGALLDVDSSHRQTPLVSPPLGGVIF